MKLWNPIHLLMKFFNIKLIYKLLISYVLLIIMPLGLLSFFCYNRVTQLVLNHVTFSAKQNLEQVSSSLNYKLYNVKETYTHFIRNVTIIDTIKHSADERSIQEQIPDLLVLQSQMRSLEESENVRRIKLYVKGNPYFSNDHYYFFPDQMVKDSKWYKLLTSSTDPFFWSPESYLYSANPVNNSNDASSIIDPPVLSLVAKILDPDNYNSYIGVARFDFKKESVIDILKRANAIEKGVIYIVNSHGDIIADSDSALMKKYRLPDNFIYNLSKEENNWRNYYFGSEKALVSSQQLEHTDWYIVATLPFKQIENESKQIRNIIILSAVIIAIIAFIIAYIISLSITRRLSMLTRKMRNIHKGEFCAIETPVVLDEIGLLLQDYNYMIEKMVVMIDEQYRSGQKLKSAELKALQSQINPHFLYNTLEMVTWYARMNVNDKIISIIESLSNFYKLSLNKGSETICIEEELSLVSNYFSIQNMRFSNRMTLSINVDEEIKKYSILKITLQPIVENAILHGILCKKSKSGSIIVDGRLENDAVIFTVQDDGVGIPADKVRSIFSGIVESRNGNGIGLKNTNERLKLFYGEDFGLTCKSTPEEGTTIEVRIKTVIYNTNES